MSDSYIRKAKVQDVKAIHGLLMSAAKKGLLLPRSFNELYGHVRDFYVVADRENGAVQGCSALSVAWEDIAEVRSLAVAEEAQGRGLGKKLLEACMSEALTLGLSKVFTLTYIPDFFRPFGFDEVNKEVLPQKIWADCIHCVKFPECDEIAMLCSWEPEGEADGTSGRLERTFFA